MSSVKHECGFTNRVVDPLSFLTYAGMVSLTRFDLDHSSQNQVYHLEMVTGAVRVIADGFDKCNGIAFDASGKLVNV